LKTFAELVPSLKRVETTWKEVNFEKLIGITSDFENMLERMRSENTGIVIEEIRIIKSFPNVGDEFNKAI